MNRNTLVSKLSKNKDAWKTLALVNQHFQDVDKSLTWILQSNPLLGGISPFEMIRNGRVDKLTTLINNQLDENKRE